MIQAGSDNSQVREKLQVGEKLQAGKGACPRLKRRRREWFSSFYKHNYQRLAPLALERGHAPFPTCKLPDGPLSSQRILDRRLQFNRHCALERKHKLLEVTAHIDPACYRPNLFRVEDVVNGPQDCLRGADKNSHGRS